MEVTVGLCAFPAEAGQLALDLIALIVIMYICSHAPTIGWLVHRHLRRRTYIYATDNSCSDKEFSARHNTRFHRRYKLDIGHRLYSRLPYFSMHLLGNAYRKGVA